jgi:hypothetical protein
MLIILLHFPINESNIMDFGNDKGNNFVHHEFITEKLGGGAGVLLKRLSSVCRHNLKNYGYVSG